MKKQDYIHKYNDSTPFVVKLRLRPLNAKCPDYYLAFIEKNCFLLNNEIGLQKKKNNNKKKNKKK